MIPCYFTDVLRNLEINICLKQKKIIKQIRRENYNFTLFIPQPDNQSFNFLSKFVILMLLTFPLGRKLIQLHQSLIYLLNMSTLSFLIVIIFLTKMYLHFSKTLIMSVNGMHFLWLISRTILLYLFCKKWSIKASVSIYVIMGGWHCQMEYTDILYVNIKHEQKRLF